LKEDYYIVSSRHEALALCLKGVLKLERWSTYFRKIGRNEEEEKENQFDGLILWDGKKKVLELSSQASSPKVTIAFGPLQPECSQVEIESKNNNCRSVIQAFVEAEEHRLAQWNGSLAITFDKIWGAATTVWGPASRKIE